MNKIKEYIKENLAIDVELDGKYSPGNSVFVSLRFTDDDEPFARDYIHIPENCED